MKKKNRIIQRIVPKEMFLFEIKKCMDIAKINDSVVRSPLTGISFYITKYDTIERFDLLYDRLIGDNLTTTKDE